MCELGILVKLFVDVGCLLFCSKSGGTCWVSVRTEGQGTSLYEVDLINC
jgi:hypothetical protein